LPDLGTVASFVDFLVYLSKKGILGPD